jgi:hypothetical protein
MAPFGHEDQPGAHGRHRGKHPPVEGDRPLSGAGGRPAP